MAGNYWASTQHQFWECSRAELDSVREKQRDHALEKQYPLPERRVVNYHVQQLIVKLGRKVSSRQIVVATAQVFVLRYYTKVDIRLSNPYMVVTTAVYLACKIEECPQHIRVVSTAARDLWPDYLLADTARIGESEFQLISQLDAQLVIHHPYHSLSKMQKPVGMTQDELSLAWSIVNDHYITDLALLHPPHIVAVAAAVLAVVVRPSSGANQALQASRMAQAGGALHNIAAGRGQKIAEWLQQSKVDVGEVIVCTQELISLYTLLSSATFKEREAQAEAGLRRVAQARQ